MPQLLISLAFLLGLAVVLSTRRRFDPRLARCVEPTATGYRVRLNGWDRLAHFLVVGVVYVMVVGVLARIQLGACAVVDTWLGWLALVWGLSVWQPFARFLIDDTENNTLTWPGGSVTRDAVIGVEVVGNTVRLLAPEPVVVARFRRPADAEALAGWLRERLNVSDPRAVALGYRQSSLRDSKSAPGGGD